MTLENVEINVVEGNQTISTNNYHWRFRKESGEYIEDSSGIMMYMMCFYVGLQRLFEVICQVGALHDAGVRFPPPKCHEGTRETILAELSQWIEADPLKKSWTSLLGWNRTHTAPGTGLDNVRIHWLYWPAGVGKTAVAQTLSEHSHGRKHLAASFFFSRGSTKRNNPQYLILTLAYCLATSCDDSRLRAVIDKTIQKQPGLLDASLATQFHELIVKPLRSLSWWRRWRLPKLVIIDGLDECASAESQRLVLTIITGLSSNSSVRKIPLRFLIASRPEPAIRDFVNQPQFIGILNRTILDDSFETAKDINLYLRDGFTRICENCRDMFSFPSLWPSSHVLDELVQRASGQFIYASTVLKYVEDRNFYPPDRLDMILALPVGDATAFADLDILYRQILLSNPNTDQVVQVLAFILLTTSRSNMHILEQVFSLPRETVSITLRGLHSVLDISADSVTLYHKSFADFLQDCRRSEKYFVDLDVHRRCLLDHCGRILKEE
jgi:hypothetical protein